MVNPNHRAKVSKFPPVLRRALITLATIAGGVIVAWVCAGCVSATGDRPARGEVDELFPPAPPMPPVVGDIRTLTPTLTPTPALVPVPGRTVTVLADPSLDAEFYVLYTNAVPLLAGMGPHATNGTPSFTISTDQPQQFFQMKAGNEYDLSDWATK